MSAMRPQGPTPQRQQAWKPMAVKRDREDEAAPKAKKPKRKGGKACVYCRRSHMVCEGGRPCERCIKRDIAHLCRDVTPPASTPIKKEGSQSEAPPPPPPQPSLTDVQAQPQPQPQLYDAGASNWPLLPDANGSAHDLSLDALTRQSSSGLTDGWGVHTNAEFGILSDMLKTLRVPSLPGGFVDVLSQVVNNSNGNSNLPLDPHQLPPGLLDNQHEQQQQQQHSAESVAGPSTDPKGKGKGKEPLSSISRIEQYLLAAADQPDGSRASRLTQVIRAKYEAGLLKPYDYIKGYERMNRWMDSGRAGAREGSRASSPAKGHNSERKRLVVPPPPPSGSSISPESRRRILAALEVFRPKFRRIAKELTDLDLVFVEEANERLMLQYDRALASIHTPSCIWRRTGEIQKANQEFAKLTGIPAPLFRGGQLCVYELMDEDSAVRFWEGYGKVAFEKGQSSLYTHCTLKIPLSLTRAQPARTQGNTPAHGPTLAMTTVPDLSLPSSLAMSSSSTGPSGPQHGTIEEEFRVIKTCFSITIRRDRYGIPVAIMGSWIPIVN
ncbi:hypothetical protein CC85DRAFT_312581 [Cutaneotrichosporon oleaginosum]|uniref:Zn(2)-C6 fungal-type domain-containing protein n=1 Tax=Cutaneotrichosporon oleaginosum TaxID=879819 RepID=A0A0J0XKX9_9TREE|nr:uncharacterized protein CC85DRAFT_312581 [Cutaneotrichosporon oleaginosum]KLT41722.1 hypothetical protein CC85DRAFT_312581 [Cutaneotrichosporon oleaginosum]